MPRELAQLVQYDSLIFLNFINGFLQEYKVARHSRYLPWRNVYYYLHRNILLDTLFEGNTFLFFPYRTILLNTKIAEFQQALCNANSDLVCLTETWLQEHIQDTVIAIDGYNQIRLDMKTATHGGVCIFVAVRVICQLVISPNQVSVCMYIKKLNSVFRAKRLHWSDSGRFMG